MEQLFNSITTQDGSITIITVLGTLIIACILGLLISLTYMRTQNGVHSQSFAITLIMLPVILSVIILFVGSNVARAFSLAGTVAIIRFRSAPGEPKDIGFIFFAMAAGLACGVGVYIYGVVFTILLCAVMLALKKFNFARVSTRKKQLHMVVPENLNYPNAFEDIFKEFTRHAELVKVKTTDLGSLYELLYHVELLPDKDEKEFIDQLRCRNGNLNISLSLAE